MLFTGGRISRWSVKTLSFEHKILNYKHKYRVNKRLIALVGCYYDHIFMTNPKNMAATCMRFLFLYRSKNYDKIVGVFIACAQITNCIN
jgi:hypothetical protein